MKRWTAWLVALTVLVTLGGTRAQAQCLVTGEDYTVGAKAAVVMEAQTGALLFAQEPHKELAMASTTKIMTALLTLEQPNLDEEFIVDPEAIRVEGSSMGLQEGDTVTLRNLAGGMLTASGNDAAGADLREPYGLRRPDEPPGPGAGDAEHPLCHPLGAGRRGPLLHRL